MEYTIANFGLLFAGYPFFEMIGINNPVWYVCILVQCYIIYYVIEWILDKSNAKNRKLLRTVFYALLVALTIISYYFKLLNESSFRGLCSFSIGVLICTVDGFLKEEHFISEMNRRYFGAGFLLLSVLFCGVVFLGINQRWVLQFLVYPALIFGVINIPVPGNKAITSIGDMSFDLYVIHYPLMVLIQLVSALMKWSLVHSYITMAIFLANAWCIAWLLWKYIDLPVRKIIRSMETKYE